MDSQHVWNVRAARHETRARGRDTGTDDVVGTSCRMQLAIDCCDDISCCELPAISLALSPSDSQLCMPGGDAGNLAACVLLPRCFLQRCENLNFAAADAYIMAHAPVAVSGQIHMADLQQVLQS